MSNLGWYQILTTIAKKVGGPRNLIALIAGGGAVAGGVAVVGGVAIKKKVDEALEQKKQAEVAAIVYTVTKESKSNEGLIFKKGTQFKVLETDGDAALIEILDAENNPYFVSAAFLELISDYKAL